MSKMPPAKKGVLSGKRLKHLRSGANSPNVAFSSGSSSSELSDVADDDEEEDEDDDVAEGSDYRETDEEAEEITADDDQDKTSDGETGDESDSADSNESDDSDSSSSSLSEYSTPKRLSPKKRAPIPIPKKIDVRSLRREALLKKSQNTSVMSSEDESGTEHSNRAATTAHKRTARKALPGAGAASNPLIKSRGRRDSQLVHSLDEESEQFPRAPRESFAAGGLGAHVFVPQEDDEEDESSFEEESLIKLLKEEDEDGGGDIEDNSDIDEVEERAIVSEMEHDEYSYEVDDDDGVRDITYKDRELEAPAPRSSPPTPNYYSSSDSEDPFNEDIFFEPAKKTPGVITSGNLQTSEDDDDDSYLWKYFFTTDEEDGTEEGANDSTVRRSDSVTTSGVAGSYAIAYDESTDEDENLPPPSNKKVGGRAQEILSASNMASRPPLLASWVMPSEKSVGIIDGLTTRTLSPPPGACMPNSHNMVTPTTSRRLTNSNNKKRAKIGDLLGTESDDELEELALDDFIYTSDLEEQQSGMDWTENSHDDIPLSAFRNRQQFPHRRISFSHVKRTPTKEVVITPVRQRRRKKQRKEDVQQTTDLIDELVEIGALAPLFDL